MKANELMIGDWVLSKSDDKIYKINSIITQDDGTILLATEGGLRFDYMYEPIPLTAEILEKNGFKKDARDENYYKWNWYILEDCASYDMKTGMVRIFKASDLTFCHPIGYVHELQHALRLLKKEIIL